MKLTQDEISAFVIGLLLASIIWIFIIVANILSPNSSQKAQVIECIQGELYDVTKEGNITIKDKRFDVTCEEL